MLDSLRKPFFIAAIGCLSLAVLIEWGVTASIPGFGINSLAFLDSLLLFSLLSMAATLVISERIYGRFQAIITFAVSLLIIFFAIVFILEAIFQLIIMISLLMAIPIGTIIYLARFGEFNAGMGLGLIMGFKVAFVVCLLLAHQRFITIKGLVLLIVTSFIATIIVNFSHSIVPGFLVSITDDIAAIIVAIAAVIWAIAYLAGSIPAMTKALRMDRLVG